MAALRPIHYSKFEKFLKEVGCHLVRQAGDHRAWDRPDLIRPVIVHLASVLPETHFPSTLVLRERGTGIIARRF